MPVAVKLPKIAFDGFFYTFFVHICGVDGLMPFSWCFVVYG